MKIIEGFKLRSLGREYIVIGEGTAQVNFNKMISLNETAAYLWNELIGKEFDVAMMTSLLLDRYEVSEELAKTDCENLVKAWKEAELITD